MGLSSASGSTVVVGPLVTTTYTVTSHKPSNNATTTASFTVTVLENCCPTSRNAGRIIEVQGRVFDASTGSPFIDPTGAPYPAGTRFLFKGATPITFSGLAFQPPMGSVLLMGQDMDLNLQDGASLNLAGVSITAACDHMWGRLWVRNTAAGITATYADGTPGDVNNPPAANLPTLRNQLSHSLGGIEYEQAPANTAGPYYRLAGVDFLHNEQSMVMHRSNTPTNANLDYVVNCLFDSKPESFKTPKASAVGDPDYPHYSRYHVWFTSNVGIEWDFSTFRNALFGFHSPDDRSPTLLDAGANRYENLWLAAMNLNSSNTAGLVTLGGPSYFVFPTAASLPATPQFANAIANDVLDQVGETRGIFTDGTLLGTIYGADFRQTANTYTDFTFSQRTRQVGIKVKRLGAASENSFTLLHTGIQFSGVLFNNPYNTYGGIIGTVKKSIFTQCQRGIEITGGGVNRDAYVNNPCAPTVYLPLECNTFDRGNATFPGTAYGITTTGQVLVSLDPLPITNPSQPHSNKFLDYLVGKPDYYAIYNGSCTITQAFKYTTYPEYLAPPPAQLLAGHTQLSQLCNNYVSLQSSSQTYQPGQVCGFSNPGLERNGTKPESLLQISPNPATESTTLSYSLAAGMQSAEFTITSGTDGRLIQRHALSTQDNGQYVLKIFDYQPGIYFVTLWSNGGPVKTCRLLVK